jgi:hypothetical protein
MSFSVVPLPPSLFVTGVAVAVAAEAPGGAVLVDAVRVRPRRRRLRGNQDPSS